MFSLICAWINGWVNSGKDGDFRRYRAHYDVTAMLWPNDGIWDRCWPKMDQVMAVCRFVVKWVLMNTLQWSIIRMHRFPLTQCIQIWTSIYISRKPSTWKRHIYRNSPSSKTRLCEFHKVNSMTDGVLCVDNIITRSGNLYFNVELFNFRWASLISSWSKLK